MLLPFLMLDVLNSVAGACGDAPLNVLN